MSKSLSLSFCLSFCSGLLHADKDLNRMLMISLSDTQQFLVLIYVKIVHTIDSLSFFKLPHFATPHSCHRARSAWRRIRRGLDAGHRLVRKLFSRK